MWNILYLNHKLKLALFLASVLRIVMFGCFHQQIKSNHGVCLNSRISSGFWESSIGVYLGCSWSGWLVIEISAVASDQNWASMEPSTKEHKKGCSLAKKFCVSLMGHWVRSPRVYALRGTVHGCFSSWWWRFYLFRFFFKKWSLSFLNLFLKFVGY